MNSSSLYLSVANAVLVLHVLVAAFIIFGLILIFIGHGFSWDWIRNPIFRTIHLLFIVVVAVQSWLGIVCPLTTLEMTLRSDAGVSVYHGAFISHWLQKILYYNAPPWVFIVCYTGFGMLVIISWFLIPPRSFRQRTKNGGLGSGSRGLSS